MCLEFVDVRLQQRYPNYPAHLMDFVSPPKLASPTATTYIVGFGTRIADFYVACRRLEPALFLACPYPFSAVQTAT